MWVQLFSGIWNKLKRKLNDLMMRIWKWLIHVSFHFKSTNPIEQGASTQNFYLGIIEIISPNVTWFINANFKFKGRHTDDLSVMNVSIKDQLRAWCAIKPEVLWGKRGLCNDVFNKNCCSEMIWFISLRKLLIINSNSF